ncbi:hypothetical protein DER44DRAFT_794804 [Fusarium oxysporum]|nr:hypothetical protein DER44DRAFT_794804 [Fusarium oxysporum]
MPRSHKVASAENLKAISPCQCCLPSRTVIKKAGIDTKQKPESLPRQVPLTPGSESTPSCPKRFFTDHGENERLAVGLLLSRREAGLERWTRLEASTIGMAQSLRSWVRNGLVDVADSLIGVSEELEIALYGS